MKKASLNWTSSPTCEPFLFSVKIVCILTVFEPNLGQRNHNQDLFPEELYSILTVSVKLQEEPRLNFVQLPFDWEEFRGIVVVEAGGEDQMITFFPQIVIKHHAKVLSKCLVACISLVLEH